MMRTDSPSVPTLDHAMRKLLDDNHLSHLTPRERILRCGCDWRTDMKTCRTGRFATLWGLCMLPALSACWYRAVFYPPLPISAATVVLVLTGGFSVVLVTALLTGRLDTNTGLYFRKTEPFRYWTHVLLLSAGVLLPALAIVSKELSLR